MQLHVLLVGIALAAATGFVPGFATGAEPLVLQSKVVIDTEGTGGEASACWYRRAGPSTVG